MKPLIGIKVLELGMVLQVPLAAQMLGDYGADVIKVERPPDGDLIRNLDEVGTGLGEMSCYYAAIGRNKRTLCVDVKNAKGREILEHLIDKADVLIHNFRPGVMERLGFGPDDVMKRNPRLIYAVSTAFGADGPLSKLPGQDMLAQSLSGLALNGVAPGEPPRLMCTPMVDYAAAASLTQGILAALFERERSGKGDLVTTSLFDVAVAMQILEISSLSMYNYETNWLQYSMVFQTGDGWVTVLTLFRSNPLKLLCEAFDVEDMSTDPELADASLQRENLKKIHERFGPIIAAYTTEECMERLADTDILSAPVMNLKDALEHPQTLKNGVIWDVPVPGHGNVRLAGNPVRLSRHAPYVEHPPSQLGEMSEQILSDFGYAPDEIAELKAAEIIR